MPSFNLTNTQRDIITTWLYEPNGYLEEAVNDVGLSALEAWQADNGLDVSQWIRDNSPNASVSPSDWSEAAMIWWILVNDQVNVPKGQRPPEWAAWSAILTNWDISINTGFGNVSQANRNATNVQLYDETQAPNGTVPAGAHLAQQQQIITKVIGVLS